MFSAVRTCPAPGSTTVREPPTRSAPVVQVQRSGSRVFFFFRRGNLTVGPWRFPVVESCQFFSPVTASAIPPA